MKDRSTRFWWLGWLVIGSLCLMVAIMISGARTRRSDIAVGSPSVAPVSMAPTDKEGSHGGVDKVLEGLVDVPVPTLCNPAPTSPMVVNVRDAPYGAKGDGLTDDTSSLQRAVNAVAGTGGTVLVPDGTYMVNAVAEGNMGIRLKSHMTLRLSSGTVLKAIPNASGHYAILAISHASKVNVIGGTLLGERSAHTGTSGEWGMGLSINQSQHIVVEGVTAKECWGDGFYIGTLSSDVTLCNVIADHNRRQGLSITSVNGMAVRNSTFKNTTGTEPEAGIDVEPNRGGIINNLLITGCTLTNNAGGGFQCGSNTQFTTSRILKTVFDKNIVSNNGQNPTGGGYRAAVKVDHCLGTASITNNSISQNMGQGIMVMEFSADTIVKGNTVTKTLMFKGNDTWTGGGIYISQSPRSIVMENVVMENAGGGIWLVDKDPSVVIRGNTVTGNAGHGILQAIVDTGVILKANRVLGNGKTP